MKRNPEFLYGMLYIFKRNWGIEIDKHEIDLTLDYGENFHILYDKFITGKDYCLEEL